MVVYYFVLYPEHFPVKYKKTKRLKQIYSKIRIAWLMQFLNQLLIDKKKLLLASQN